MNNGSQKLKEKSKINQHPLPPLTPNDNPIIIIIIIIIILESTSVLKDTVFFQLRQPLNQPVQCDLPMHHIVPRPHVHRLACNLFLPND